MYDNAMELGPLSMAGGASHRSCTMLGSALSLLHPLIFWDIGEGLGTLSKNIRGDQKCLAPMSWRLSLGKIPEYPVEQIMSYLFGNMFEHNTVRAANLIV